MKIVIIIVATVLFFGAFSTLFHDTSLVGNIGKLIGETNLVLFGYLAYINLLLLFYPLYQLYRDPQRLKKLDSYVGWALFYISLIILQSLLVVPGESGLVGREIYAGLLPYIGKAGLWLFWFMIFLLALALVLDDDYDFAPLIEKVAFWQAKGVATPKAERVNSRKILSLNSIYSSIRSLFHNPFDHQREREKEGILGMNLEPFRESHRVTMKDLSEKSGSEPLQDKPVPVVVEPKKRDRDPEPESKTSDAKKPTVTRSTRATSTQRTGVEIVDELEVNSKIMAQMDRGELARPKNFKLPKLDFLQKAPTVSKRINEAEIDKKIGELLEKLGQFKINGDVIRTYTGPLVTTFEFKPAPNIKVSKILGLQDDLAMALSAETIRIQAPIPGRDVVGIEIPNESFETIYLRDILEGQLFKDSKSELTIALGKDIVGKPFLTDLKKLPHLLIAGTTGSGKSVGINAMILSLLYRNDPDHLKLIMIDPKMLEFSIYNGIPHLLTPVITNAKQAISALANMVSEMERRYKLMADARVKNIESFNEKTKRDSTLKSMPYIVIIIDELADLMMNGGKEVEYSIARLAQMARASGIHLVVATQRPSVDVVTGLIKANLPSRLSYRVGQRIDSKVILDQMGAETLLGRGDALFTPPGTVGLVRLHAPWSSEEEIEMVVEFLKAQREPSYDESILAAGNTEGDVKSGAATDNLDSLYDEAKEVVINDKKTSISYLQRKLQIGYNRSANIIDQLEATGVLSEPNAKGAREIL